jgi:hypothetical protein
MAAFPKFLLKSNPRLVIVVRLSSLFLIFILKFAIQLILIPFILSFKNLIFNNCIIS